MPYYSSNSLNLFYEVHGDGDAIILLHGLTSNHRVWKLTGWVDELSKSYRVITADARGHGLSDKPGNPEQYSFRNMASDVVKLMEHLGIDKAIIFGYSMGGMATLALCQHYSDRIRATIIGGASPNGVSGAGRKMVEKMISMRKIGAEKGGQEFVAQWKVIRGELAPHQEARYLSANPEDFAAHYAAMTSFLDNQEDFDEGLRTAKFPVMILIGENDEYFSQFSIEGPTMYPDIRFAVLQDQNHSTANRIEYGLPLVLEFLSSIK